MRVQILVVEDNQSLWEMIRLFCESHDWQPAFTASGEEALEHIRDLGIENLDGVILDLCLPGISGFEVLRQVHQLDPSLPVIVSTGLDDAESAVSCMKSGAYDYITKPFLQEEFVIRLEKALNHRSQLRRLSLFEAEDYLSARMGPSQAIAQLATRVGQVAPTGMTVLIEGESGTGKELIARRIHSLSRRSNGPFIVLDCGAIPETLIESELFGFKKGSFTGANEDRIGKFEAANRGTLFLDEIGNLPRTLQAKLLRVLQEREVTPIGSSKQVAVDIRIVSATNASLNQDVERSEFRLDLYHRLAEFPLEIPPIRERPDDLLYLASQCLRTACTELNKDLDGFSELALEQILARNWPGNVRELQSVLRRATLVSESRIETINFSAGPGPSPGSTTTRSEGCYVVQAQAVIPEEALVDGGMPFKPLMKRLTRQIERGILSNILEHVSGNKSKVARILKLDYKTVHTKIKEYKI